MTNPALPALERPPEYGPSPVCIPAAGSRADKRCPKCGLLWFYTKDVSGDLTCVYCGCVVYRVAPDQWEPGRHPAKCGRVVLS